MTTVGKVAYVTYEELNFDVRAVVGRLLTAPLPRGAASRLRARVLRLTGMTIGDGTLLLANISVIGSRGSWRNVTIGRQCFINDGCTFDAAGPIELGDEVNLGQGVLITTSSHVIGAPERRAGQLKPEPVRIGHGAWIASRAVVLPGVEVGEGAIVAAGAVVARSVAPNTLVGGVPARVIRHLDH
jgi:maltose O-acetyltransferase